MTDRELLELAAKAAGLSIDFDDSCEFVDGVKFFDQGSDGDWWNPLIDDGDALRLAVKLRLTIKLDDEAAAMAGRSDIQAVPFTSDKRGPWYWKEWNRDSDPYAATRLAIVRAAAEIGQFLGEGESK